MVKTAHTLIGQDVGTQLAKAFNIPIDTLRGFTLRCFIDEPVTITVEYQATEQDIDGNTPAMIERLGLYADKLGATE